MLLKFNHWAKPAIPSLVVSSTIVSTVMAFSPQFLAFLHEAPFPVSDKVDVWVTWILKGATLVLGFFTVFTKKAVTPAEEAKETELRDQESQAKEAN